MTVDANLIQTIVWLIFLGLIFINILYPDFQARVIIYQALSKIEPVIFSVRRMKDEIRERFYRKVREEFKLPKTEFDKFLSNFSEFFIIQPINLDPHGIVEKIEHIFNYAEDKIRKEVSKFFNLKSREKEVNYSNTLYTYSELHSIEKFLIHNVEMIKKTNSIPLAYSFLMVLPLIKKVSKALYAASFSFLNKWPIGDSIGPLISSKLIKGKVVTFKDYECVLYRNKNVFVLKAEGPMGNVGKIGRAIEYVIKKYKIKKLITIDAALKLEGEKSGSIARGVGVAIGGIGIDRAFIENIATRMKIKLECIIIKMDLEEALFPMKKEIFDSVENVLKIIEESLKDEKENVLIAGIGNTIGVGNSEKDFEEAKKVIESNFSKIEKFFQQQKS